MASGGTSRSPTPRRWTRLSGPHDTALLLERDREIAELDAGLEAASQGSPRVVLIGGDAGMGKTTVVAHLGQRAARLGFTVAVGHGLDLGADLPFAPVIEAVGSLLDGVEEPESRPAAARMHQLLDPSQPRATEGFSVLEDLRHSVLEAAQAGAVLLVLEDMHWA